MSLFTKKAYNYFIALPVIAVTFFCVSCEKEVKNAVDFVYDPELIPTVNTDSVTMLVSDSGLIRYKMVSKTWQIYEQAKDPYWLFPDGFYLEQYDSTFTVVAVIKADTVWEFTKRKFRQLKGHVSIRNNLGETFTSEELFWDQRLQKVYSNKLVEIDRPGKVLLHALNFQSNEQMTDYTFSKVHSTKIYVNEDDNANEEKTE